MSGLGITSLQFRALVRLYFCRVFECNSFLSVFPFSPTRVSLGHDYHHLPPLTADASYFKPVEPGTNWRPHRLDIQRWYTHAPDPLGGLDAYREAVLEEDNPTMNTDGFAYTPEPEVGSDVWAYSQEEDWTERPDQTAVTTKQEDEK